MALLQANTSPVFVSTSNNTKNAKTGETNEIDENANVNIVSNNSLLPSVSPMGMSKGADIGGPSSDQVSVYVVKKGDSISQIAGMFDVSVNTILAANDMKKGEKLVEGDVLLILPIDGLEHTVVKGDTLQSIAKHYKADVDDIALYNGIAEGTKLAIGDKLMIPGGEMADEGGSPVKNLKAVAAKDKNYYATHPLKDATGYFINPVPTGIKTQGLHGPGKRGIDIGAQTGTPIYASASGTVLVAKTGCVVGRRSCGGGYGNMLIIQHDNGTETLYGHMSKVATSTGAGVSQGQVIGYVGSTGKSTGAHLHFEVKGAKNPGADWSWKQ